jgi:exodeoxyribonuclease V beta subunit
MSREFAIKEAPLTGVTLIDASAGTGKTYTIAALVLRLLLEKGIGLEAILVVTYTEAAVDDLKTRVRQKIIEAIAAFTDGVSKDAFLAELLLAVAERSQAVRRLITALRNFDEAAIFTIHGFCRRVLHEHSLESGVLFDSELLVDQHDLLKEITEDFFRRTFYEASPLLAAACFKEFSPATLLNKLGNIHARDDLRIIPVIAGARCLRDLTDLECDYQRLFLELASLWPTKRTAVGEMLLGGGVLNGAKYNPRAIPGWLAAMDRLAALDAPPLELFEKFGKFTTSALAAAAKKGAAPPADEFFDLCEKLQSVGWRLHVVLGDYSCYLEAEFFAFVREELQSRKAAAGSHSFDDLLTNLHQALGSEHGPELIRQLNAKYRAAMIDEFQDTDPVQYEIFARIFKTPGSLLYLIGDPKQAIYSFRGADIFAYIRAVREVGNRYTLAENWRSVPDLVAAVNAVFNGRPNPFVFAEIDFNPARAAEKPQQPLMLDHGAAPPFQLWAFQRGGLGPDAGKLLNKDAARALVLARQTAEVVRLLALGGQGRATVGARPLTAGDLAILVRTNHEARLVQESLAGAGVTSAINSSESLFASREAVELRIILQAMLEAGDSRRLRAALATRLLGGDGRFLDLFAQQDEFLVAWLGKFRQYQEMWGAAGFAVMFGAFLENEGVRSRLLVWPEGERGLTNVLHLLEVLHLAGEERVLGMAGLVKYLSERIVAAGEQTSEAQQLRLESDADLVQIVTIHKAKGLQYPVVFCPFCWEGSRLAAKRQKHKSFLFHDPAAGGELKLDIGSAEVEANRCHAIREELAENLRLLYVALTRAAQCCYLAWGPFSGSGTSALAYLLHAGSPEVGDREPPAVVDYLENLSDAEIAADLQRLVARSGGTISLHFVAAPPAPVLRETGAAQGPFSCRDFTAAPRTNWRISSFSALSRRLQTPYAPGPEDIGLAAGGQPGPPAGDFMDFPRGAGPGSFLHAILEELDFSSAARSARLSFLAERLLGGGYDSSWLPALAGMVEDLLHTPLEPDRPDLILAKVGPAARLNELEFYFPLADFNPAGLDRLLADWAIAGWPAEKIRGFMKGYIDLVFCHGEKFYIVDWKSNFLGRSGSDYQRDNLRRVMAREHYCLQYLIYTVALHRYLRVRLPGYDYEKNFGGVYYIFLRGLDRQFGQGSGIYRDKPPGPLVRELSDLFGSRR